MSKMKEFVTGTIEQIDRLDVLIDYALTVAAEPAAPIIGSGELVLEPPGSHLESLAAAKKTLVETLMTLAGDQPDMVDAFWMARR